MRSALAAPALGVMSKMKKLLFALGSLLFAHQVLATSLKVPVEYPEYAIQNCIEGIVKFRYTISIENKPEKIQILDANPKGIFEEATIKNVSRWHVEGEVGTVQESQLTYKLASDQGCNS
ncbi:energy transducer TonB [Microbulbifer hydrolyticus]|uniref:Outer membrane biosynthesis protein TonB n=1 Tax=Microbulbifer hydrolyticus TaxID=48074 RepID=A0A6P1T978_9GAMM|nr:energy transducer TonB [Microbulbifer hydrolyticus]MBB5213301.1 outer membrane biosynthesis protein TonB [Microbulbifer hydrolyticus]QHQ38587.1 hypothetical protein GTQ55_06035 [Microbulbifer hydrolyticus]